MAPHFHGSKNTQLLGDVNDVIFRLPIDPEMPEWLLYRCLEKFIMSTEKMELYGYPIPDLLSEEEGKVIIPPGLYPPTINYFNSNQRTCSRCKTVFKLGKMEPRWLKRNVITIEDF